MVWYDDSLIERTVTRQFVVSHLLPEEVDRLDRPLGFGDGLTDGTYWEWIDQKAKKIFLILVDLGVPDQIFGVIDDSWDDEDLPIAREHVERLALLPTRDARFDRKFYQRQFYYLLKPLERCGTVAVYDDMDVVPLNVIDRRPSVSTLSANSHSHGHHRTGSSDAPLTSNGSSSGGGGGGGGGSSSLSSFSPANTTATDRVVLPNYPGMVFSRRRIPLAQLPTSAYGQAHGQGYLSLEEFQHEVSTIRSIQNDHLVSYWTSYVHQGCGYVLFTPASDSSLKSLLATTPAPIKNLAKQDRRRLVFNWIHCLVDTLCFVHSRGLHHGNIKPSNVLLAFRHHTGDNHIFYSDFFTQFAADANGMTSHDRASFSKESYDYAAPEQWYRPAGNSNSSSGSNGSNGSSGGISSSSSSSRKSMLTVEGGSGGRGAGMSMYAGSVYSCGGSSSSGGDKERKKDSPEHTCATGYAFQMGASGSFTISRSSSSTAVPQLNAQAADIFSLGCIILELMTFMLKRQTRAFATHRAAKHKTPGRGGAVLDSSFHKNLGQVESWMAALAKDAAGSLAKKRGKDDYDATLAGVVPMLHVVERMLALHASERPSAYDVQTRMYQILRDHCGILEPHCVHEYGSLNAAWATSFGGGDDDDDLGSAYGIADTTDNTDYAVSSPQFVMSFSNMSLSAGSGAVSPTTTMAKSPAMSTMSSMSNMSNMSTMSNMSGSRYSWSSSGGQRTPSGRRPAASSAPSGHIRTDSSGGSSARSSTVGGIGGASVILEEDMAETERAERHEINESNENHENNESEPPTVNGLQAIRNLQIRDKARQSWNAPVYAS